MIFSSLDLTTMYLMRASVSIVPLLPRKGRLDCKRLVTSKKNKQTKQNTKIRLWFLMYKMLGGGGEVTYEVICHLLNHRCDVNLRKIEIDLIDIKVHAMHMLFIYFVYLIFSCLWWTFFLYAFHDSFQYVSAQERIIIKWTTSAISSPAQKEQGKLER